MARPVTKYFYFRFYLKRATGTDNSSKSQCSCRHRRGMERNVTQRNWLQRWKIEIVAFILTPGCCVLDFQYVVKREEPHRICFGSSGTRNTDLIGSGLSPFQKRLAGEQFPNVTPQTYEAYKYTSCLYQLENKVLKRLRKSQIVISIRSVIYRYIAKKELVFSQVMCPVFLKFINWTRL